MSDWKVSYKPEEDIGLIEASDGTLQQEFMFQHGPIQENGVNGIQNEQVLELLIERTKQLDLRMPCEENERAIQAMNQALDWFAIRTSKRKAQGVEGTNRPHGSTEAKIDG